MLENIKIMTTVIKEKYYYILGLILLRTPETVIMNFSAISIQLLPKKTFSNGK